MREPTDFHVTFMACIFHERAEYFRYAGHTFAVLPDGELTIVTLVGSDEALAAKYDLLIDRCLDMLYERGARIPEHLLA